MVFHKIIKYFKGIKYYLNLLNLSFVKLDNTNLPLIFACSSNNASQWSVPLQNNFFISFIASWLKLHNSSAKV